jgi:Domain of unknown function (DU1801)
MASSKAATVDDYLAELPPERRSIVASVRDLVRRNLPQGYQETMNWGMISYEVPLERYPDTHNKQPLMYAGLAAQKNFYTLYLNAAYQDRDGRKRLEREFKKAGKKLDMGKSCLHFNRLDDLPLDVIARVIGGTPPEKFIEQYEAGRKRSR